MTILALELSTAVGSIAFRQDDGTTVVRQFPADRQHSGLFFENLSELRRSCGLPEKIAVGLGPGSYAGSRIALATALGLRAACGAELVGLPSICAYEPPEFGVVGDARRGSYYFARVRSGELSEGPSLVSENELREKLDAHPELPFVTAEKLAAFPEITLAHPSAELLAHLAETAVASDGNLEPIYLRPPYITQPRMTPWNR